MATVWFNALLVITAVSMIALPSGVLSLRRSEKKMRRKCHRDIGFCTRQNIDVFSLFVQTVLSIDLERITDDDAHRVTQNLCITFRPVFECVQRRNASSCSVPIGQDIPNKSFHISYFVLVCELSSIWRECSVLNRDNSPTDSVKQALCSEHFPALNKEATQLRLLNNPLSLVKPERGTVSADSTSMMMADQQPPSDLKYSITKSLNSMELILLNITESHCEDIMMFVGCQLHWTRSICGEKAYDIVRRLFSAYNDMSGKKCNGNHELRQEDFDSLETKYTERYLYLSDGTRKSPMVVATPELNDQGDGKSLRTPQQAVRNVNQKESDNTSQRKMLSKKVLEAVPMTPRAGLLDSEVEALESSGVVVLFSRPFIQILISAHILLKLFSH